MNQVEAQVLLDMIEGQLNYHNGWVQSYNLLKDAINNTVTVVNTPLQNTIVELQTEKQLLVTEKETLVAENTALKDEVATLKNTPKQEVTP